MYADRLNPRQEFKPGSMILALGMTALPIVGLITATQVKAIIKAFDPPIEVTNIKLPKDPPPPQPQPKTKADATTPIERPYTAPIPPVSLDPPFAGEVTPPTPPGPPLPPGSDIGTKVNPPPPPVIVGSQYDSRYNNALQPPYPADKIRAGESGRVVVRVLVGADGRVKQVEFVSGADGSFFESTQRQAMAKWRFKPATRDGVPFEQWKTMSLRFELANAE